MKPYLLIPLLILSMSAFAQTQPPQPAASSSGSAGAPAPQGQRPRVRFVDADTDHDGRLSRTEAQAMPFVAKHFDQIDTNHDGYITRDELKNWHEEMQAIRQQRAGSKPSTGGVTPPDSGFGDPGSN